MRQMNKLVRHYNDLLTLPLQSHGIAGKPKKATPMVQQEIVEKLFESNINDNQEIPKGWVHIVECCMTLA